MWKTAFLIPVALLLLNPPCRAEALSRVMEKVLELREERNLGPLKPSGTLERIADLTALANLNRTDKITHTDEEGKNLDTRSTEAGYPGATGEIVAVRMESCSLVPKDDAFYERLGKSFREMIRGSPAHYRGLTAQSGYDWTEIGWTLREKKTSLGGRCMEKYSLSIVLGLPDPTD